MTRYFSVQALLDPGHWDINGPGGRMFTIRGEGDDFIIRDERPGVTASPHRFNSVLAAMTWILDQLMVEPRR